MIGGLMSPRKRLVSKFRPRFLTFADEVIERSDAAT